MIRVGLFGSIGAGKEAVAHLLAVHLARHTPLKNRRCKVRHIQEFSVLWTDKTGGTKEVLEQFYIWYMQRQWDHDYDSRMDDPLAFIIHSAPAPLAYFYTLYFADLNDAKHRWLLQDLYGRAMKEILEYDVMFYIPLEFPIPEGDRLRKKKVRSDVDRAISSFLVNHRLPFIELRGSWEQRARKAFRVLKDLLKKKLAAAVSQ